MDSQTIINFFESFIGEIPPEMETLFYIFALLVVIFIIDSFFIMLSAFFKGGLWHK